MNEFICFYEKKITRNFINNILFYNLMNIIKKTLNESLEFKLSLSMYIVYLNCCRFWKNKNKKLKKTEKQKLGFTMQYTVFKPHNHINSILHFAIVYYSRAIELKVEGRKLKNES